MIDYQVQLIQFPDSKTKETVVENESSLDSMQQRKAFHHAMKHILGDDFNKRNINRIEYAAHGLEIASELYVAI